MGAEQDVATVTHPVRSSDSNHQISEKQDAVTTAIPERSGEQNDAGRNGDNALLTRCWRRISFYVFWAPPNCRWNPDKPPEFSLAMNILFAFAGAFTVANLYYNHPILNVLARDFDVPYVKVSEIPTLAQAGYCVGLLFICPLGDVLRRRPFVLGLVLFTATMSIGLASAQSIAVFSGIQFIVALTTVTPQIMMPLVGDLAPPHRRATALSIVTSGFMLGILIARLLSGILTQYTSWRNIYWFSVGAQYTIFILLYFFMPDYPSTNPGGLNYIKMLWSIVLMLRKHPVLVQACIISFFISSTFTNYWTVLTFLLAGPPYHYDSLVIGLFALIGIASLLCGPPYARYVIDRFVPAFTVLCGIGYCMLGVTLGTYTGTFTVAGPVLQAFLGDFGMQVSQIANRAAIYAVEPRGRNRVNTAFMVFTFCGQLLGTSVGSHLFARGGWIASGSYSVAAVGAALLVTLARGPWEEGWIGWHGGWSVRKKNHLSSNGKKEEVRSHLRAKDTSHSDRVVGDVDVEKGALSPRDEHEHHHGRDDQGGVNAMDAEKSLELAAAEEMSDKNDEKDEAESQDEIMSDAPKHV